jgi:hypothetical protein
VARRRAVAPSARGGEVVQASRTSRARLILAAGALAALAGSGAFTATQGGSYAPAAQGAEAAALLLLAVALTLRWAGLVPWALIAAAGGYLAGRVGHDTVDGWAAVVGVLLLLSAELATWSIDADARIRSERSLIVRRSLTVAALCAAALLVNFLLLATSAASASSSVLLAVLGTGAAVAAVAVVLRLVRSTR